MSSLDGLKRRWNSESDRREIDEGPGSSKLRALPITVQPTGFNSFGLPESFAPTDLEGATPMSKGREIHCYDYVNHPYEQVRDALSKDAPAVFQSATKAAASRARSIASELRVDLGGIGITADIRVLVKNTEVKEREGMSGPTTRLQLEWEAATMPILLPLMKADLSIYPITATETQLDFKGFYEPPLGAVGKAVNAIVGHRIAEASVHRFVSDVAEYLRKTLL
jgi:hypothetical protein